MSTALRKNAVQRSSPSQHPRSSKSDTSQPGERKVIITNGILTAAGLALTFYVLYYITPIPVPPLPGLLDRLVFTLRLQSFSCLTLIGGIQYVALTRFSTTAIDPINGQGEHHVAVGVRYLTNTVEQLVVSSAGQLILTTYLEEGQMRVIPILVLFFVFGRLAFFFGYRASYLKRTAGFVATFAASVVVWVVVMFKVITSLLQ
ncbi:unnamed protein product [Lymnaea stagnalis]|uniref:MAPEG family protein n=1 Tax=Lymnaea stagnalis TaxID=6523 RepID=A0AAV2I4M0_LYMST